MESATYKEPSHNETRQSNGLRVTPIFLRRGCFELLVKIQLIGQITARVQTEISLLKGHVHPKCDERERCLWLRRETQAWQHRWLANTQSLWAEKSIKPTLVTSKSQSKNHDWLRVYCKWLWRDEPNVREELWLVPTELLAQHAPPQKLNSFQTEWALEIPSA